MNQYIMLLLASLLSWGGVNALIAVGGHGAYRGLFVEVMSRLGCLVIGSGLIICSWVTFRTFI